MVDVVHDVLADSVEEGVDPLLLDGELEVTVFLRETGWGLTVRSSGARRIGGSQHDRVDIHGVKVVLLLRSRE